MGILVRYFVVQFAMSILAKRQYHGQLCRTLHPAFLMLASQSPHILLDF
jgi:hypothetical protein